MILSDKEIIKLVKEKDMIKPFVDHKVKTKLSWGLDPFGYTISLSGEFKIFNSNSLTISEQPLDPLQDNQKFTRSIKADNFLLMPKHIVLGKSIEYLKIPSDITGIALTKSSYARVGIFANITALDAGWNGFLTIEIANLGNNPVIIHAYMGIAQILFFKGNLPNNIYRGKYQNLKEIKV